MCCFLSLRFISLHKIIDSNRFKYRRQIVDKTNKGVIENIQIIRFGCRKSTSLHEADVDGLEYLNTNRTPAVRLSNEKWIQRKGKKSVRMMEAVMKASLAKVVLDDKTPRLLHEGLG